MFHFLRNCPKPPHSGWDSSLVVLVGLEFLSRMDVEFANWFSKSIKMIDCGSDHELLMANSGLNWRKGGRGDRDGEYM